MRVARPFPAPCPRLRPAAALALNLLLPQQFMQLWAHRGGSALLRPQLSPPSCSGVGLEGETGGLCDPAAQGSVAAPAAVGGRELCGTVDTKKSFKTQRDQVPRLQRAPACLCVTRESLFQLALLFFTKEQVKL